MEKIPLSIEAPFKSELLHSGVSSREQPHYLKWLRYYLDFCRKYEYDASVPESLPHFIQKLSQKRQNMAQQKQAEKSIRIYYGIIRSRQHSTRKSASGRIRKAGKTHETSRALRPSPIRKNKKTQPAKSPVQNTVDQDNAIESWSMAFDRFSNEIKVRHYSPKTLKSYGTWIHKFQYFCRSKEPDTLTVDDVKAFLTFLAVKQKVSASSQNQSFNALLFFFRHVLKREFGKIEGVVRAKQKPYIPVVLSREEVDAIIGNLKYPYALVAKLLYGCGLRLFESLNLRIQDLNFDTCVLTVHDGKGKKDRTVPLPETAIPELKTHLNTVIDLHEEDLESGYAGTFLPGRLGKKYKNADKELSWQWLFPAKMLTLVAESNEYRRYHLHETHVQKAIKRAVRKSRITKRASAHTFRHSFASHLLQANYDIRTIQELLGHSDVRTTMIYTHTIKSQTIKEAKSPLDF